MATRPARPEETQHITAAYVDNPYWATQKYIDPANRNGYSIMECMTCHQVEATRKRFRDGQFGEPTTRQRIANWKRVHQHKDDRSG